MPMRRLVASFLEKLLLRCQLLGRGEQLSEKPTKRKIPDEERVNLVGLCLLALAITAYWIYNPSLLSELIGILENAVSGSPVLFSDVTINFALLFILFSAFRFLVLMVVNVAKKRLPMVVGNLTYCFILAVIAYLFNSWFHVTLSTYYIVSVLLFLIGVYEVSKGVVNGLFRENQPRILIGDWRVVLFGIRILILSALFTEGNFLVFRRFTTFLTESLRLSFVGFELIINFIAFMIICLFVYLLTELPKRLIFTQCKRCNMVFLNIGVREAGWNSEHTLKHKHCPRCGAACF